MRHQKQQLQLAQPSWGFFLGHCHVELSWPQASREELKVSSQTTEFLFQTQRWKLGCPPWIQQQGAFLSHPPLLSCCSTVSDFPGRHFNTPQHLNVNFPSWLSYFCTEKQLLGCEGRTYSWHTPSLQCLLLMLFGGKFLSTWKPHRRKVGFPTARIVSKVRYSKSFKDVQPKTFCTWQTTPRDHHTVLWDDLDKLCMLVTYFANFMQNWVKYFLVEARLSRMMGTFCLMWRITEVT